MTKGALVTYAGLLSAAVTAAVVVFILAMPQEALACSCAELDDTEAFERADVVFTGTLTEIITPGGDLVVSSDPERFVFVVDDVFKGQAQSSQSVVTARDGASCGLEIGGPGPFVVFARLESDGLTTGAVEGEVYSDLCSGTRALTDGAVLASFGGSTPPIPANVTIETPSTDVESPGITDTSSSSVQPPATTGAAAPDSLSVTGNDDDSLAMPWWFAIGGVLALGAIALFAFNRHKRSGAGR
jgi:hypothetical protein